MVTLQILTFLTHALMYECCVFAELINVGQRQDALMSADALEEEALDVDDFEADKKPEDLQPSVVYQQRLLEERKIYENEQQREVERLKSDLKEKKRLARMLDNKEIFRVIRLRQPEFERLRSERSILVK
ncbi:hypothetical protein AtNW77_Chr4g0300161 [Arabidopsis thaliana]